LLGLIKQAPQKAIGITASGFFLPLFCQNGNALPLTVYLSTQSGKKKLAHLLLHTLYPHQQP
jgi:hypothetical protein